VTERARRRARSRAASASATPRASGARRRSAASRSVSCPFGAVASAPFYLSLRPPVL